jgi:RNA polymerase sigma-70 factor, ECF subfamily
MAPSEPGADQKAAPSDPSRELFERYSRRLIGLARQHLDARLQHKVDPEDVVQSVYKSFFLRYGNGGLAAEGWEGLWGLLTLITLRKCADRARYHRADRRDMSREQTAPRDDEAAAPWQVVAGREPTPDQAAVLAETVELLLGRLDRDERAMIELSLQGFSTQEISAQTGRAERSVRRVRERVRQHLQRQQLEGAL